MDTPIRKKPLTLRAIFTLIAGLLAASLVWYVLGLDYGTVRIAREQVQIVEPQVGTLTVEVSGSGRVRPDSRSLVVAPEAARVSKIHVRPGAELKPGELLVQLVSAPLRETFAQAQADLKARESARSIKRLELVLERASQEDRLTQSKGDYETAQALFEAYDALMALPSPPISQLEYEKIERESAIARQQYERARERLTQYEAVELARIQQMDFEVSDLRSRVSRLQERLDSLSVTVPEVSVVRELHVERGQQVERGQAIADVYSKGGYYVEAEVPASGASRLSNGLSAEVTLSGESFPGEVLRIDPQVRGSRVTVDVRLDHPEPAKVKVNSFATVKIQTGKRPDVVQIPVPEGVPEFGTAWFYVLDRENPDYAERRSVTFGVRSNRRIEVVSGLVPGERVIISHISSRVNNAKKVMLR